MQPPLSPPMASDLLYKQISELSMVIVASQLFLDTINVNYFEPRYVFPLKVPVAIPTNPRIRPYFKKLSKHGQGERILVYIYTRWNKEAILGHIFHLYLLVHSILHFEVIPILM